MVCIRMEIKHSNIARHVTKEGRRKTKQAHGDIAKTRAVWKMRFKLQLPVVSGRTSTVKGSKTNAGSM